MSVWKDRNDLWRYRFQLKKQNYSQRGFKTKKEAVSAQAKRRGVEESLVQLLQDKQDCALPKNLINPDDAYAVLKNKYSEFLKSPFNTLPDLIDIMFHDFGLTYSYEDIKKIANTSNTRTKISAKLRTSILKRDGFKCVLCGATANDESLHVDHIVAVSRGGLTEARNLRVLCSKCNFGKSGLPFMVTG